MMGQLAAEDSPTWRFFFFFFSSTGNTVNYGETPLPYTDLGGTFPSWAR